MTQSRGTYHKIQREWDAIRHTCHISQGVYSDMYMTGGLSPGIFWDTQKNKYQEKSDPKKWVLCAICAIRLNFLSSIFSANFKNWVMNHWVVYFYLHSLMLLFEQFCKSRSFNRTHKKINCIKIVPPKKISEKSSDPKNKRDFSKPQKNKNIKNFRPKKVSQFFFKYTPCVTFTIIQRTVGVSCSQNLPCRCFVHDKYNRTII